MNASQKDLIRQVFLVSGINTVPGPRPTPQTKELKGRQGKGGAWVGPLAGRLTRYPSLMQIERLMLQQ